MSENKVVKALEHVLEDDGLVPRATSNCRRVVRDAIPIAKAQEAVIEAAIELDKCWQNGTPAWDAATRLHAARRRYYDLLAGETTIDRA